MNRVFITGMGIVSPIGIGKEAFLEALKSGKSGVNLISSFDTSRHASKIAAEVKDFDPSPFISKKEIRRHDRYSQFAMAASQMAIQDSGISSENTPAKRIGVILSTGIGGIRTFENECEVNKQSGPNRVSPFLVPMMICNIAAGYVGMYNGFKGPNFCVVSACASALHGMGESFLKLAYGQLDAVITGGAEAAITPLTLAGFSQMKALSTRNDAPAEASRPFDKDRDGFVMGEGSGVFVFETEENMNRRGGAPLAEVVGYGASADAHHLTAPDPNGEGAYQAMSDAIEWAKVDKEQIVYVNSHGTSTPVGDPAETLAIKRVFGNHASKLLVNSTKSMVGHLLGAAAAVGTVAAILQMKNGFVHPTINHHIPGEGCDLDYVPLTARDKEIEYAVVNSFGFGGQNGSLLLKRV